MKDPLTWVKGAPPPPPPAKKEEKKGTKDDGKMIRSLLLYLCYVFQVLINSLVLIKPMDVWLQCRWLLQAIRRDGLLCKGRCTRSPPGTASGEEPQSRQGPRGKVWRSCMWCDAWTRYRSHIRSWWCTRSRWHTNPGWHTQSWWCTRCRWHTGPGWCTRWRWCLRSRWHMRSWWCTRSWSYTRSRVTHQVLVMS